MTESRELGILLCFFVVLKYMLYYVEICVSLQNSEAVVVEWLSSWLAKQEVRGLFPGLAI